MSATHHEYRGYVFTIDYRAKEPAFRVHFADFPEIITSSVTLAQAFANACEALDLHLESLQKLGKCLPRPKQSLVVQPRQQAYLQLLESGLISLRNHAGGAGARVELCLIEADHLHNLPSLFQEPNELRHQYYIVGERSLYIERLKKLRATEYLESMMRRYAEPWKTLASIAAIELSE